MKKSTISPIEVTQTIRAVDQAKYLQDLAEGGKQVLDRFTTELGLQFVNAIFHMEREQIAGPRYHPTDPNIKKWASQKGSIYLGKAKHKVMVPRLRGAKGEIPLTTYQSLHSPEQFSEELLTNMLTGMAGRRYKQTVTDIADKLGVSSSSVSRHIVAATSKELQKFRDRDLKFDAPFAILLDTVHRGDAAFIVALGVSVIGKKTALGFWEGATENSTICTELLNDLENRGLELHEDVIFVCDGGKGIHKALKMRFGANLLLQRCTVHKCRNIEKQLPEQYRKGARMRYNRAIGMSTYEDAKKGLQELKKWLQGVNESAANSLLEGFDELLTLHKLNIPTKLRSSLRSTNAIESLFSKVRYRERNIRRWRSSNMRQRWLGTVLLYCEKTFNRIRGYGEINDAINAIKNSRIVVASKKKVA